VNGDRDLLELMVERGEKIALYVAGVLQDLVDEDLVERPGESWNLSPKGLQRYDQLRASGFRPSREEIGCAMFSFKRITQEDYAPNVVDLIEHWDEVKVKLEAGT
jgi:hypothetical protein